MSEIINGYVLSGPLTNANAGYGRWGFADKDGTEYFIKEFLNPIYPTKDSPYPEDMHERIKNGCKEYQKQKQRLYRAINETSDGNLVRIEEFFRWGSKYYITTRRIPATMKPEELCQEPWQERLRVCCTLCHSLMQMHEKHIVHADIKADNIILTKSIQGGITAKLIDVDCSFFEDTPPEDGDDLGGDQIYFSPEGFLFKYLGPEEVTLTCQMDVYAMGILMHQLLTGEIPTFDPEYNYAFESSLDDKPIVLSAALPVAIRNMLGQMLQKEPEQRLTMKQVFYRMRHILAPDVVWDSTTSGSAISTPAPAPTPAPAATPARSGSSAGGGRIRFGSFDRAIAMVRESSATPTLAPEPVPTPETAKRVVPAKTDGFFSAGGDL